MVLCNQLDADMKAEIIWAIKNVHSNMSAASCDDLKEVFQAMFPGAISEKFSLGRTKLGYLITEALGPYFKKILTDDVQQSTSYCLSYDETTNVEHKKELQVRVRYFSETNKEVVAHHVQTFFMGHATAEELAKCINKAIVEADFLQDKLIMLGADGPNVNKKVWSILNTEVNQLRGKGLLDIGSCNIHIIHNAFLKGLSELGNEVSDLILQIYYFFHGWPSRCEDFEKCQIEENLPTNHFIKHVATRWLTLEPSAQRVLEQWKGLTRYFLRFIPNKKDCKQLMASQKYLTICKYIRQKDMKAQFYFVIDSAAIFTKFSLQFQKEEPLIHILFDELQNVILTLAGRVCKVESLKNYKKNDMKGHILFADTNLCPINSIVIDKTVQECLNDNALSDKERQHFLLQARNHYKEAALHILKKSSLQAYPHSNLIYSCRCLQPQRIKRTISCSHIVKIAEAMPLLEAISSSTLLDEWKLLQLEDLPELEQDRIDHYWQKNVFSVKDSSNIQKYPIITRVVKACLALAHGSADVERGFSRSKRILSIDKAAMSERTLNARLAICDGTKKFKNKPHLVPITRDLITSGRLAHQNYTCFLEEERKKKYKTAEAAKAEKMRLEQEKENLKEIESKKQSIEDLEVKLKVAQKEQDMKKQSADALLSEANKRLQVALKNQDLQAAQLAQGLIEGAEKLREQERTQENVASRLAKQVEKRKSGLLSDLFAKKQKITKDI
ncbi:uncharacterized protein LOC124293709 [Neodiprion lecontei]|uniref:Uncharacterized protein LOC124293709 n=1 Tax=Neodiprion lecontei TaxID=441921 RepID=A0ABM3FUP0_NEOLC|nr:uncharacterized protein LOC124293709 [Neodiprion lecontei]